MKHLAKHRAVLPRGKHLFLKYEGRSRTGMSQTVTVLVRDDDAQPGRQMANVSLYCSEALEQRWHSFNKSMIMQRVPHDPAELGAWIAGELGKKLHESADAFTWEWL